MVPKTADPTRSANTLEVASEITPLLNGGNSDKTAVAEEYGYDKKTSQNDEHDAIPATQVDEDKPLPYVQVLLLCYVSIVEPIAYFAIFPFMPEMIELVGNQERSDIGFWAGIIESLFSLVQMVLMIFYGRAADRIGRKPVLIFSLAGMSLATMLFGMSQDLTQMILLRCTAGLFAGSVVTVRSMLSENCTKKTQGKAFSWYMFTRNMGIFIGPLVGGLLADPVTQYPSVFKGVWFWEKYPYSLSTIAAGAIGLTAVILATLFLNETLERKSLDSSKPEPPMSTWEVLKAPGVKMVLYLLGYLNVLALGFTAVCPVFLYTDIELGGFNFSDRQIASFLAISGVSQALWMLLVFPPLQNRKSTGFVLRACCLVYPIYLAAFPLFNELLRHGYTQAFWIAAPISVAVGSGVAMFFTCIQLCVNDIAPSPRVLGTVNALALTVTSGTRAFVPVLFSSIFASGVKLGWADGHLIWIVLVTLSIGLLVSSRLLPTQVEGKGSKHKSNSEDTA